MIFKNDNNPSISENEIARLETRINHQLPIDYRQFLLSHNGGIPERTLLHIPDCQDDCIIDFFLGILRPHGDILDWLTELEEDLADNYIPIAFDPAGNALLMDLKEETIHYWDSARHFPESTDEENAYWVADSFTQLIESLQDFHG